MAIKQTTPNSCYAVLIVAALFYGLVLGMLCLIQNLMT